VEGVPVIHFKAGSLPWPDSDAERHKALAEFDPMGMALSQAYAEATRTVGICEAAVARYLETHAHTIGGEA
jgi:hypothetical protein